MAKQPESSPTCAAADGASRMTLIAGLLVVAAIAGTSCSGESHVEVVLEVPSSLRPDGFRVARIMGELEGAAVASRVEPAAADQPHPPAAPIIFRVGVPEDGSPVTVRAQALRQGVVLAEARTLLSARVTSVRMALHPLASLVTVSNTPTATPWMAPVCEAPVGGSPAAVVRRPATVSAGCDGYCTAMELHCPTFHGSKDRCLASCERLQWPAGNPGEGGDTLGCRQAFAQAAGEAAGDRTRQIRHCTAAMPRSEGNCGSACEIYCRMGSNVCTANFPPLLDCLRACGNKEVQLARHPEGPQIGQWLLCRLEQLEEAVHEPRLCGFAGVNSCGPCAVVPFEL